MSNKNNFLSTHSVFLLSARYFAYSLLICLLMLGGTVIFGWYTHNALLIQLSPNYVPMQFNTALNFIVIALALLSVEFHYRKAAQMLSVFVVFISTMVLLEYMFSFHSGLDQLFIKHYITTESSRPGQMAPNTALAFIIAGISILLRSTGEYKTKKIILVIFLNFLLFIIGYTTFMGYYFGASTFSRWGTTSNMAWHTAFGLMLWGGLISSLDWWKQRKENTNPKYT